MIQIFKPELTYFKKVAFLLFIIGGLFSMSSFQKNVFLKIKNPVFDFGSIIQDTVLSHTFTMHNISNQCISIRLLSKSCNCTEVFVEHDTILPQSVSTITLKLNTKGKSGIVNVYTIIESNTAQRYHKLQLTGNVISDQQGKTIKN